MIGTTDEPWLLSIRVMKSAARALLFGCSFSNSALFIIHERMKDDFVKPRRSLPGPYDWGFPTWNRGTKPGGDV